MTETHDPEEQELNDISGPVGRIGRASEQLRNEVSQYFEERFDAIEDQLLALRRYMVRESFREYVNVLRRHRNNLEAQFTEELRTRPGELHARLTELGQCTSHIKQRALIEAADITASRHPERALHQIQESWSHFLQQRRIDHPEMMPFPPSSERPRRD